jgi:hypothetical protein
VEGARWAMTPSADSAVKQRVHRRVPKVVAGVGGGGQQGRKVTDMAGKMTNEMGYRIVERRVINNTGHTPIPCNMVG